MYSPRAPTSMFGNVPSPAENWNRKIAATAICGVKKCPTAARSAGFNTKPVDFTRTQ